MSDKRQETVSDIVREMRIGDLCADDTVARSMYINDFLASYADRIEAAWKRESEATAEKSSAVGNAGTVREVAQEMLNTSMQSITAERINGWAVRLAEACEQSVTDCNHLGNAAKMREALSDACYAMFNFLKTQNGGYDEMANALDKAKAALATHPRNCDIGTVEEHAERFDYFCYNHRSREKGCGDCPLLDGGPCEFAWMQMPYGEVIATISQPHRGARRNAETTEAKDPTHGAVRKG